MIGAIIMIAILIIGFVATVAALATGSQRDWEEFDREQTEFIKNWNKS